MDPEMKNLLEENLRLSKENNELLLKIRSVQRWSQITRALYWFVIIAISLGAFYYMKPYLGNFINIYSGGVSNLDTVQSIRNNMNVKDLQQLVKDLNN